jgi:hypothetical protein
VKETSVETSSKRTTKRLRSAGLLRAFQKTAEESATRISETSRHEAEKLAQIASAIDEAIRLDQNNVEQEDGRVRDIIATALPGFERMLRALPIMNEGDNREFMRSKGFKV